MRDGRLSNVISNSDQRPYGHHTYAIGGNTCPFFAIGAIGADDDFYLVGAVPSEEVEGLPMITGSLLDSTGRKLCRIVRNAIDVNYGNVTKVVSDVRGYEIQDRDGALVMRVKTRLMGMPSDASSYWRTVIEGSFHNASGDLVVQADGDGKGMIQMGAAGCLLGNGINFALSPAREAVARAMIKSHGALPNDGGRR